MSRTKHHGDKAKSLLFDGIAWNEHYPVWINRHSGTKKKRSSVNHEWMRTPGWWVHEMMDVPKRAQVRNLINKTLRLFDLEEAPLFPLAKKPHHYFW
jgi:hypothetical protein